MDRNIRRIGFLLLVLAMAFTSCRNRQHLEVTKSLIVFSYAGGNDGFNVEADCNWSIDNGNTADWLTINPLEGTPETVNVAVTAEPNDSGLDRNTTFTVVSENGKIRREVMVAQSKYDIMLVADKVWFLRTYERWDTDYWNQIIPESFRSWIYYADEEFERWFFYFMPDNTGTQVYINDGDTTYYPYTFEFYPDVDSLNIYFESVGGGVEDYHAIIHELNLHNFSFSDPYRPHQYEKLNLVNVSRGTRNELKINPKRIAKKPAGPLIPVK